MGKRGILIACLCLAVACGNGLNGSYDFDPVDSFEPLSVEEEQALARMRASIDAAERFLADPGLSGADRARLRAAVDGARDALAEFISIRRQGAGRRQSLQVIGVAATAIVANDAIPGGVIDDPLLVVAALAAMVTIMITKSPASADALEHAWRDVGTRLDTLRQAVETARPARSAPSWPPRGASANQNQPGPTNQNQAGKSTTPVPVPVPDTEDQRRREACRPKRVCPRKGRDAQHDRCANSVTQREYVNCDVLVNGKHFDALDKKGVLWEAKTDNWKTYTDFLKGQTLVNHLSELKREQELAAACGFEFKVVVGDRELRQKLSDGLKEQLKDNAPVVEYKVACDRTISP